MVRHQSHSLAFTCSALWIILLSQVTPNIPLKPAKTILEATWLTLFQNYIPIENLTCLWFCRNGDAPFVIVINTLMGSGQFLLINRLCVEDDVRTHTKTQTSAMASTGFTRKPAGLALGPGEYTTLA